MPHKLCVNNAEISIHWYNISQYKKILKEA